MPDPSAPDDPYVSPLAERYAGPRMQAIFGRTRRYRTWRALWIALAELQQGLGLPITDAQLDELRAAADTFDWDRVAALEAELRHDVMAHIRAYAELCPTAGGVLHLGATSCFVTDNADQILLREALREVAAGLAATLAALADAARTWRATPCLGYTHFQAAQLVTVGKRITLWAQDLLDDLGEVERLAERMPLRGAKGTTGTQASYLTLFGGDADKVAALDRGLARRFGFERCYPVTGQTYPRKLDARITDALSGVAQSAARMATDIRLLSGTGELSEPIGSTQVGSSAMPYKRNPMRCERVVSLARLVRSLATSPPATAAEQWLERSLDDSANRRLVLPEAFLATDAILRLLTNVARGLVVHEVRVARRVAEMMPFGVTETLLMRAVEAGGDRQALHEVLRSHARAAWAELEAGRPNDLLERIQGDPAFAGVADEIEQINRPEQYVGRAPEQVDAFLADHLEPALAAYPEARRRESVLTV